MSPSLMPFLSIFRQLKIGESWIVVRWLTDVLTRPLMLMKAANWPFQISLRSVDIWSLIVGSLLTTFIIVISEGRLNDWTLALIALTMNLSIRRSQFIVQFLQLLRNYCNSRLFGFQIFASLRFLKTSQLSFKYSITSLLSFLKHSEVFLPFVDTYVVQEQWIEHWKRGKEFLIALKLLCKLILKLIMDPSVSKLFNSYILLAAAIL